MATPIPSELLGPLLGAIALGAIHGVEPGHGWPVAASYALTRTNEWVYGLAASLLIGIGHLVSSVAMVLAFFYAKNYFDLTQVDEPIHLVGDVHVGGPVSLVAGAVLVALGIHEYRHGHVSIAAGDEHGGHAHAEHAHAEHAHAEHAHAEHAHADHAHADHAHSEHGHHERGHRDHEHAHGDEGPDGSGDAGLLARLAGYLPFGGGHHHAHDDYEEAADRGLLGIAWFAFLLGFAHEEEFEIIALCAGSAYCLELMLAYALAVVVGIVGLTMLLIAGHQHYRERVERVAPYLPVVSAVVLVTMGLGFALGLF